MSEPAPARRQHPLSQKPTEEQPPVSRSSSQSSFGLSSMALNNIGVLIDRWSDVVDGKADIADKVRDSVLRQLQEKGIRDVTVKSVRGNPGQQQRLTGTYEERPYIIAETTPGVKTAIYIAEHGKDLYVSWRTHVRGVINVRLLIIMAVVAFGPALCLSPCLFVANIASSVTNLGGRGADIGGALVPSLVIAAVTFAVECLLLALWGFFAYGDYLAFFFVEPSLFDAEDVAALSITADHAIRDAVKESGVDISQLKSHTTFQSGRKSEKQ